VKVDFSQTQELVEAERKIVDLQSSGEDLVVLEEYHGSRTYKKVSGSYSFNKTLDPSRFLSSVSIDNSLKLMIQGSYDRVASVFMDSGSGFSSIQNISTDSQILDVDFNSESLRLLLGHLNGGISSFYWDSPQFHSEANISSEGTRIYGVKSCPDKSIIALR
jgi:hypothetical protein